jgi:hypothetical protein
MLTCFAYRLRNGIRAATAARGGVAHIVLATADGPCESSPRGHIGRAERGLPEVYPHILPDLGPLVNRS